MSDPLLAYMRNEARKELGAALGVTLTVMALVTTGLLAWIKWGGH